MRLPGQRRRPRAAAPVTTLALAGHAATVSVHRVIPLPGGERAATAAADGAVRLFSVASGERVHELVAGAAAGRPVGLAALGGDVFAAGGPGGTVVTWGAGAGERLATVVVVVAAAATAATAATGGEGKCGSAWVSAVAAQGEGRFVVGTSAGGLVFYTHRDGRDVVEVGRAEGAHEGAVEDVAVCGGRQVTAGGDKSAAVWDVRTRRRLAALRGHCKGVCCVALNEQVVATGSHDASVRVYSAESFECVRVLSALHSDSVRAVVLAGAGHLLSGSEDETLCVTALSTGETLARTRLPFPVLDAAVAMDGRLAVCGRYGAAAVISAPPAAAELLEAHAAAARPPLLQNALQCVFMGAATPSDVCLQLVTADACSASLAEWKAAHELLLLAEAERVRRSAGGVAGGETSFGAKRNWWLLTLCTLAKTLPIGQGDSASVKGYVQEAVKAGVLDGTAAALAFILARKDLVESVELLRNVGDEIQRALDQVPMTGEGHGQLLESLVAKVEQYDAAQEASQLVGVFLHLVVYASGVAPVGFAGAAELIQELLDAGAAPGGPACGAVVGRVLLDAKFMLSAESVAESAAEERGRLETVATALGRAGVGGLRQLFAGPAQSVATSAPSDAVRCAQTIVAGAGAEVDGAAKGGADALEDPTCGNSRPAGSAEGDAVSGTSQVLSSAPCAARERDTGHVRSERGTVPRADDAAGTDGGRTCARSVSAEDAGVAERDAPRGCFALESRDGDSLEHTQPAPSGEELSPAAAASISARIAALKVQGVNSKVVSGMSRHELASTLAAFMICYDANVPERFVQLRRCLTHIFRENDIAGQVVVGNVAILDAEFYDVVVAGMGRGSGCQASIGYRVRIRAFLSQVHAPS
jgi:WD domain, G-beta repeat